MAAGHSVMISGLMIVAALVVWVVTDRTNAAMSFFRKIMVCIIFGFILVMGYMNVRTMDEKALIADRISAENSSSMSGRVYDIRESGQSWQVYVKAERIDIYKMDMKVIVYMTDVEDIRIGQEFVFEGKFARPDAASNPGEFDAVSYYLYRGIYLICRDGRIAGRGQSYSRIKHYLYRFRVRADKAIGEYFDESDASVVRAMLLGEKSGLDRYTKKLFQINGIAHILAISGVHIAIIGMTLFGLLRKIFTSNVLPGLVSVGVIMLYGIMTGLASSTTRAVIMMAIVIAAKIKGRSSDMMTSAGIACVVQAFVNPYILFDAGFQLSFAAVLGIAVVNPLIVKIFPDTSDRRWRCFQKLKATFLINISVTLTEMPLVIYYYYQFPLYSAALNMIIIPLVTVVIFCSIAVIFFGMLSGGPFAAVIAGWASFPAGCILELYRELCRLVCRLPGYNVNTGHITVEMAAVFYVSIVLALWLIGRRRNWIHVVMAALVLLLGGSFEWGAYDRDFRVVCMDVGQGDGILIRSGSGTNIMIDGGSSDNSQVGEYVIAPVLRYYGAAHLDYAIVTHADSDHISGLIYLLEAENTGVVIDNIILPMYGKSESFEDVEAAAKQAGANIFYMKTGDLMSVQKERFLKSGRDMAKISLSFLYPGPETGINDVNELSAVLRLDYQGYKMLFTGDLGETGEKWILEHGVDVNADVLKVGHHGSRYSSCDEFLDAVSPETAIISAGEGNRYGHPHEETLDRLEAHGAGIFCTIECGAVNVVVDRGGLKTETYR